MDWRLAASLRKLREQVNAAYPGRDKASDGAIGDANHASRNSDHNPWIFDGRTHVVSAIDIDEDLSGKEGTGSLGPMVAAICSSRDPRVKYIIYEGRITVQGSQLQQWKPYTGKNAHRHHAHISVFPARNLYDSTDEWQIGLKSGESGELRESAAEEPVLEIPPVVTPAENPPNPTEKPVEVPQTSPILGLPVGAVANASSAAEAATDASGTHALQSGAAAAPSLPPQGGTQNAFNAFVPQIDTAKSWVKRATTGTAVGTALAFIFKLPEWLQIGLFSLTVIIVIGGIVMFVKYHKEIFAYVTQMNTLRATDGAGDPVIVGKPPTD